MVFGVLCEELGLIVALCAMLAIIALAIFTVKNAAQGRSSYYVIAGCATVTLMLVQMSLNVFGVLDILPFTGVTFPFVSKGGSSMLSCWMLLAYIKAADTRARRKLRGAAAVAQQKGGAGMNKVKRRAMSVLLVAVLVLGGIGVYIVRYIEHGAEWATFAANSSVYTSGVLNTGTLTDRSGVVLATASGGSRSYAEDAAVRKACYQTVGDYAGNIGTGALKAFSKQLSGYNPITGTYATDGHTVALTLDSSLCVTAYEALAGRKGAVLVSNYKTGEVLCMVSGPSIDPAVDGDVPDGAYINRCINGSFTPGSIYKLITSAAALENIKDISTRRFTCAAALTSAA